MLSRQTNPHVLLRRVWSNRGARPHDCDKRLWRPSRGGKNQEPPAGHADERSEEPIRFAVHAVVATRKPSPSDEGGR